MKIIIITILLMLSQVVFSADKSVVQISPNQCVSGVHKQPNGPFAIYTFCDDALGTNISVFLADLHNPVLGRYTLIKRFWQNDEWGADITSIAWLPDGKRLIVATSPVYGTGRVYILTLESQKFEVFYIPERDWSPEIKEIKGNKIILNLMDYNSNSKEVEIAI